MTIKVSGRSALILAIGLLAGLATQSHAAALADASSETQPGIQSQVVATDQTATDQVVPGQVAPDQAAPDQANDSGRAAGEEAPNAAMSVNEAPSSTEPAAPSVAGSDDNSPSDTASLIGKIFIGVGTLLTLASAARMFMA
jgi:hypothetical protein